MGIWEDFYEKARSFFSNEDGRNDQTSKKRCYYDILEVGRDATEDEIKKSFKKLALKWHPDKNPDRLEECTAYFVILQQAYEVLVDPQERAFYDRHRENIIYQSEGPNEKRDTGINLKPFIRTSCFGGLFSTDKEREENFYSVFRDLFHKLAAEEYEYIDDFDERNFPVFGKSNSDYETIVAPFYAFWSDFSTRRSFAWLDKWNLNDAPDRATARAMEKENRRLREIGKRQRNEDVRELVAFVKKHDKRVAQQKEYFRMKMEEQKKRTEEARICAIKKNLENIEDYELDEELHKLHLSRLEEIEEGLDAEFGVTASLDDPDCEIQSENEQSDNYCLVCDKAFKSKKSLINHQKSKKHKQAVDELKKHMKEEDKLIFAEQAEEGSSSDYSDKIHQTESKRKNRRKTRKSPSKELLAESQDNNNEDLKNTETRQCHSNPQDDDDKQKPPRKKIRNKKIRINAQQTKLIPFSMENKVQENSFVDKKNESSGLTNPIPSECKKCGQQFESRSKLFNHLKETGHAAIKIVEPVQSTKKSSSKTK